MRQKPGVPYRHNWSSCAPQPAHGDVSYLIANLLHQLHRHLATLGTVVCVLQHDGHSDFRSGSEELLDARYLHVLFLWSAAHDMYRCRESHPTRHMYSFGRYVRHTHTHTHTYTHTYVNTFSRTCTRSLITIAIDSFSHFSFTITQSRVCTTYTRSCTTQRISTKY